jgi:NADP-dependent 3-hydroxy acid dehydrogenase YdfG
MATPLQGSDVLLTGASGGIGRAIAAALVARGARVLGTGRRADALEQLGHELGIETAVSDLADRDAVAALAERAGAVDVLVANAALPASGTLDSFSPDEIDRALDVNLRAPVQLVRALAPGMVERGRGHVVLVSSLSGKVASVGSALYSGTKFGLRGFAAGLREDLHGTGVGVSVVYPGFVRDAGMFAEAGVELPRGVGSVTPDEVAAGVVSAIERGRPEVDVAPLGMRIGVMISSVAPVTMARVQRRLGSAALSNSIAAGQRGKR